MPEINIKQRKIMINELPSEIPDFLSTYEPKDSIIKKWIIDWILSSISKNKIKENDILPNKSEISKHLGVSIGTVQNAIRYVEDSGFVKSKQRLGTMIANCTNPSSNIMKSTSKRDKAIIAIKKILILEDIQVNKPIPSTRKMSELIGLSQNTVRLAYEYLCTMGLIKSIKSRGNDSNWFLMKLPVLSKEEMQSSLNLNTNTLVEKITSSLKAHLSKNYKIGDKIPTNESIAKTLEVSVKTVHDAIKLLSKEGIIITRRGRYGSILAQDPLKPLDEESLSLMFSSASDTAFYSYQKVEDNLIKLINDSYNPEDKLPSMSELAKMFDVSTNTIRKALKNLAYEGYITFERGRWGGTFVIEKPNSADERKYQWLSINPNYI